MDKQQIEQKLAELDGWQVDDQTIHRDFKFDDFGQAFTFMRKVAEEAERLNHHPDWSNSYNRVSISLTSHGAGGLTETDFALASLIDQLAGNF